MLRNDGITAERMYLFCTTGVSTSTYRFSDTAVAFEGGLRLPIAIDAELRCSGSAKPSAFNAATLGASFNIDPESGSVTDATCIGTA